MFDAKRLNSITKEYKSKKIAEEEKRRDEIIESIIPFLMGKYDIIKKKKMRKLLIMENENAISGRVYV